MDTEKGSDFVEKMIRASTWWKVKTHFEKEWLGKEKTHFIEDEWEKDA